MKNTLFAVMVVVLVLMVAFALVYAQASDAVGMDFVQAVKEIKSVLGQ